MSNLPLAFAEILIGGIFVTAGITGEAFSNIIKGEISTQPLAGAGSGSSSGSSSVTTPTAVGSGKISTGGSLLTSKQKTFASDLASYTGLNVAVVEAWVLNEESGAAAQARQAANNNDWLNIGYTDSATYGASDRIWGSPQTAAAATADWLKGQNTIPGYGTASAGVQNILNTAGQSAATEIAALQHSGWASSGYPDLGSIYEEVLNAA